MGRMKYATAIALAVVSTFGHAAQPPAKTTVVTRDAKKTEAASTARPAPGKGPTSIGPLRLGMTLAQVQALKATDDVFLAGPPVVVERGRGGFSDAVRYKAMLKMPVETAALEAIMDFRNERLAGVAVQLRPESFEVALGQIAAKYGKGEVSSFTGDKRCYYGDDNRPIPVQYDEYTSRWRARDDVDVVETVMVRIEKEACKPREGDPNPEKSVMHYSLTLKRPSSSPLGAEVKNVF